MGTLKESPPDQLRGATEMIDDRLRIERLVRANARRAMVIDIIERLVEDPGREDFAPSDMEYWSPLHDALREKLRAALAEPVQSGSCIACGNRMTGSPESFVVATAEVGVTAPEGYSLQQVEALRHHKGGDKTAPPLAEPVQEPQTTHSAECWRWHHKCAVAKIERECKHD